MQSKQMEPNSVVKTDARSEKPAQDGRNDTSTWEQILSILEEGNIEVLCKWRRSQKTTTKWFGCYAGLRSET